MTPLYEMALSEASMMSLKDKQMILQVPCCPLCVAVLVAAPDSRDARRALLAFDARSATLISLPTAPPTSRRSRQPRPSMRRSWWVQCAAVPACLLASNRASVHAPADGMRVHTCRAQSTSTTSKKRKALSSKRC